MFDNRGKWSPGFSHFIWLLIAICLSASTTAGPLGLPDSARPGAVRPEEVGKPIVPEAPPAEVMEIPAVIDRPFEIDEGPKVIVSEFRLLDAKDLPKFDITVAEVTAILRDVMASRPEGFTIGQMQEAADGVTRYYREKGLILAQAVVPVQVVQNGIVDIQVFEGILGRVLAEGNADYSERMLKQPFKKLIGKPVTKDSIESALLQLTDFPGLSVFGVFQPGQLVGTADIVLKVQEEDKFDFAMRFDNHGLQATGRGRFRTTIDWNNVTGGADKLSATIQQTYRPKNNTFQALDYEHYLGYGTKAGISWNKNRFDVGGELAAQQIVGQSENFGVFLDKSWLRSRQMNFSTRLDLTRKESLSYTRGILLNRDNLSVLSLEANFDNVDTRFKGINFATLELSRGFDDLFGAMGSSGDIKGFRELNPAMAIPSRQGGPPNRDFAEGQFYKMYFTASRLQTVLSNLSLLARMELQLTENLLVPLEQYSVGGPDNLRAYPQAQFLMDNALFFSFELIQNMPFITDVPAFGNRTWGELVQLSIFYDHVIGNLNEPLAGDPQDWINFKGAGIQARFTLPGALESRLMMAWPMGGFEPADNGRRPQIWGDLTYRF